MEFAVTLKRTRKKGLGVFALKDFKKGELIEAAPVLIFTPKDRKNLEKTPLSHYIYPWRSTRGAALAFGYGSVYNHSYPQCGLEAKFQKPDDGIQGGQRNQSRRRNNC